MGPAIIPTHHSGGRRQSRTPWRYLLVGALTLVVLHDWYLSSYVLSRMHSALLTSHPAVEEEERLPGDTAPNKAAQHGSLEEVEIWAASLPPAHAVQSLRSALDPKLVEELSGLCGASLYKTLTGYTRVNGLLGSVIVATGDIPAMWIRDSAVQMGVYLPRIQKRGSWIRVLLEGAIRSQAFFVLQDPWANAYNLQYTPIVDGGGARSVLTKNDRVLGRGGWVWTRNFELDSSGYFFNLLHNYYRTKGLYRPDVMLAEPLVHDAVLAMLRVLETEQHHEERSPYRYSELAREGLGVPTNYTGMIWSGFRPSDDMNRLPFNIPANMYVCGALERIVTMNAEIWKDPQIDGIAHRLATDIRLGIEKYGIVPVQDNPGVVMYAYEVDGLGNVLKDMDDPNLPSLLAMPLLGYKHYDKKIYAATRTRILSAANPFYFSGKELRGEGSPHTPPHYVWPLALAVQALTAESQQEAAGLLADLAKCAAGNHLVHESVHVDQVEMYTRPEFGWAQAMLVVAVEQLLGVDCDERAEGQRLDRIMERENKEPMGLANGGKDASYYYNLLSAEIDQSQPGP